MSLLSPYSRFRQAFRSSYEPIIYTCSEWLLWDRGQVSFGSASQSETIAAYQEGIQGSLRRYLTVSALSLRPRQRQKWDKATQVRGSARAFIATGIGGKINPKNDKSTRLNSPGVRMRYQAWMMPEKHEESVLEKAE